MLQPVHTPAAARSGCHRHGSTVVNLACTVRFERKHTAHGAGVQRKQVRTGAHLSTKSPRKRLSLLRRVAKLSEYAPQREEVAMEVTDDDRARRDVQQARLAQEAPPATAVRRCQGTCRRLTGQSAGLTGEEIAAMPPPTAVVRPSIA